MSDEDLRTLRRDADASQDPRAWIRLGLALARLGRADEAGNAALRARARGGDASELEDALALPSVEALASRGIGAALTHGPLSRLAWSADGRTLLAVAGETALLELGLERGQVRRVAELPGETRIQALAPDLEGRLVALAVLPRGATRPRLVLLDRAPGATLAALDLACEQVDELAFQGDPGLVVAGEDTVFGGRPGTGHVRTYRFDPARSSLVLEGERAVEPVSLTPAGQVVAWHADHVVLPGTGSTETRPLVLSPFLGDVAPSFPTARAARAFAACTEALSPLLAANALPRIAFAADPAGRLLAVSGAGVSDAEPGRLDVIALGTLARRAFPLDGPARAMTFSPSGRTLAVATATRVLLLEHPPTV